MKKKTKILNILLLVLLALVVYLIFTSESVKKTGGLVQPVKNENVALSEEGYRTKVKEIFTAYEKLALDDNFTTDKIEQLKNELLVLKLDLKTRIEFQKLHLGFIQALDKTESYLNSRVEREKISSQQMIDKLKVDYSWLNN